MSDATPTESGAAMTPGGFVAGCGICGATFQGDAAWGRLLNHPCTPTPVPPVPDALRPLQARIRAFHEIEGCGVGGPLHIITDDSNVEDSHLDVCLGAVFDLPDGERQGKAYWREGQSPADTARMVEEAVRILWELRGLPVEVREAVCDGW